MSDVTQAPGPLAQMAECQERLAAQCAALHDLVPSLKTTQLDAAGQAALQEVMRYFDEDAPRHYADEEKDLFPALIDSMAGSDAFCLRDLTQSLAADHRILQDAWLRLRDTLQQLLAGQRPTLHIGEIHAFIELQEVHSQREDSELLPMAQRLLSDDALAQIARGMERRRAKA